MVAWLVLFLAIVVIAAAVGFGGIVAGAAAAAKIVFWIFLSLFVIGFLVSLIACLVGRTGRTVPW